MKVILLDGYVDEPSNFGVPPFLSPYPRYLAGAISEAGHTWDYATIEEVRKGRALRGNLLAVISGPIVPGKYLRSLPMSEKEMLHHGKAFEGEVVLGGPLARFRAYDERLLEVFDGIAIRDFDAAVYDWLERGDFSHRDRTMEEWDRWAVLGAEVAKQHPDFPQPLIAELDTSKGCVRYLNGGCSFCIEPEYGRPKFRPVGGVLAEARRLGELGVVNFRLGGQADFFSYLAEGVGKSLTPKPNLAALEELLAGIRRAVPDLKVLHTDNGDPAMIVAHPVEATAAMKLLVKYSTPGTILSFGLESADPKVHEANNLNVTAEECLQAIRLVNQVGRERGENGMPHLLPGLNFVAGLAGETKATFEHNRRFLSYVLEEDLWVRRINLRQVNPVRAEFPDTGLYGEFRRFKDWVRTSVDHVMLQKVIPAGTVLRSVFTELQDGHVTFGRQVATYGLLVGIPYDLPLGKFFDVKVTEHGQRSITAVEYPLDVNRASLHALTAIPGIGAKRAARLVRARPFQSVADVAGALDDAAVASRALEFVTVGG